MSIAVPRFPDFVGAFTALMDTASLEADILTRGAALVGGLVAQDDWLPDALASHDPVRYRQYLLHCDLKARFSVVSFVWGPGHRSPIHDHQVWGLIGMLRGAEEERHFSKLPDGSLASGESVRLEPGQVGAVSPRIGDIHQVANAFADRTSISIHVYGADIGTVLRHVYDPHTGAQKPFVSGYSLVS